METKHTKGQWTIDKYNSVVDSNGNSIRVTGLALAGHADDEVIANTKLIAAAPELLEALQWIAYHATQRGCSGELLREVAQSAINKATK